MSTQTEICKAYVLSLDVTHPPEHWERITGITVIDPDGWDRNADRFDTDWAVPVTYAEFRFRCSISTCRYPRGSVI